MEKIETKLNCYDILHHWPKNFPVIFLGGGERFAMVATHFTEVSKECLFARDVRSFAVESDPALPFISGFVGLLSYDEFNPYAAIEKKLCARIFRVERALVFDYSREKIFWTGDDHASTEYSLGRQDVARIFEKPLQTQRVNLKHLQVTSEKSDDDYLGAVAQIKSDIRQGRFYQINFLRYFNVMGLEDRASIAARLMNVNARMSAFFDVPRLSLVSFSPERFVKLTPDNAQMKCATFPIKGTIARPGMSDMMSDILNDGFSFSRKEVAELNMIVDLMRNDLNKVSVRNSVRVVHPGRVESLSYVHHRVAEVSSILESGQNYRDFFSAICPAGSITGAPKIEVMKAIREREDRERGYFMGNAFYADDRGGFDSSVLIRTLAGPDFSNLECAAGSGIVSLSDPRSELAEIKAKCKILESMSF